MNPFQSIADYFNNDLYRWETDEERKNRYYNMYPMGDAHLGHWDFLERIPVRKNFAPGYQHWDERAEDTGPAGYDASVQDNILKKTIVETPEGTTTTVKTAPRPKPYPIARGLPPYYPNQQGISPVAGAVISAIEAAYPEDTLTHLDHQRRSINDISGDIQAEQFNQARAAREWRSRQVHPSGERFFEGPQGASMRQGGDMMHALALQDAALNQRSPSSAQVHPAVSGRFYEESQGRPMFDPNVVGPAAAHTRALQAVATQQPRPYTGGNVSGVPTPPMPVQTIPTYPDAGGMHLQNRNEGQIRADLEAERNRISRLERERAATARAINAITTDQANAESALRTPGYDALPESITGDLYTDSVIDFVGRDAEADERGMKDWYSQMAREAVRKFNRLPSDEAVTPVYKRKASGPSKRTMNKGSTSKSKKKQRGRGRRY